MIGLAESSIKFQVCLFALVLLLMCRHVNPVLTLILACCPGTHSRGRRRGRWRRTTAKGATDDTEEARTGIGGWRLATISLHGICWPAPAGHLFFTRALGNYLVICNQLPVRPNSTSPLSIKQQFFSPGLGWQVWRTCEDGRCFAWRS